MKKATIFVLLLFLAGCGTKSAFVSRGNVFELLDKSSVAMKRIHLYPVGVPNIVQLNDFTIGTMIAGFPFDTAGVQVGDFIESVDDKAFNSCGNMLAYLDAASSNNDTKFGLRRDGVRIVLYVTPRKERPRFGFKFRALEYKYYVEDASNAYPPKVSFMVDGVRFFIGCSLLRSGIIDCELIVENFSNEKLWLSQEHIEILVNGKSLKQLSVRKIASLLGVERGRISNLDKVKLKDVIVPPGGSINRKLWFHNRSLSQDIRVKIKLTGRKTETIAFDIGRLNGILRGQITP